MNSQVNLISDPVSPRLAYVVEFINQHPYFPFDLVVNSDTSGSWSVVYGKKSSPQEGVWHIPAQHLFFSTQRVSQPLYANMYAAEDAALYSVEIESKNNLSAIESDSWQFDVFEAIFFHISRYEEVFASHSLLNEWDMLAEEHHFLIRNHLEKIPVVDDLVKAFTASFTAHFQPPLTVITLTHDIDYLTKFHDPFRFARSAVAYLFSRRKMAYFPTLLQQYLRVASGRESDPYLNDQELLSEVNVKKEIYFFVAGQHRFDPPEPRANQIRDFADRALERGYVIGAHPSYLSWRDKDMLRKEIDHLAKLLDAKVVSSRQHYLHFDPSLTPALLISCGIREDASLGYNQYIGFRCGTSASYQLYDFRNERAFELVEKPLVFMDSACMIEGGFDPDNFLQLSQALLLNYRSPNMTLNVHNSFYADAIYWGSPMHHWLRQLICDPHHLLATS